MPAFAYRHVKDLYPIFWEKSTKLVKSLMAVVEKDGKESVQNIDDAAVIECADWSSRATLDIISVAGVSTLFGVFSQNTHCVLSGQTCLERMSNS